jgi:hypothetical protein
MAQISMFIHNYYYDDEVTIFFKNSSRGRHAMPTISSNSRSQIMFRRSTHSSFSGSMEGDQFITHGGSSATLPRGPFLPTHSRNTAEEPLIIPLNQTVI